jgi:hypothetical protein
VKAVRQHGGTFAIELFVNVALPFACYSLVQPRFGDVRGLLASSVPPILWSVAEFVRKRRVDAVSVLVLLGIALSLVAFIGGGSVKFLQLRENLVTGLIGLVFLGSAAIGKPLIYQLALAGAARQSAAAKSELEQYKDNPYFRRTMSLMTLVWGCGLLGATAIACVLVFTLSIRTYLIVSPFVGYGIMGVLALWTVWFSRRARKLGLARRAAAMAAERTGAAPTSS